MSIDFEKMINHLKFPILALVFYFVVSLIFTYPLIFQVDTALLGGADAYFYPWNVWEFTHKVDSLENPFFTNDVLYPLGANLFFHAYGSFTSFFFLIFSFFNRNLLLFQNLVILSGLIISALSAYLLIKFLFKKEIPALLGGFFYGFSPVLLSSILRGHYYFSHAEFLPLGILACFYYLKIPSWRRGLLVGLVFWLSFLNEYYQTIFLALSLIVLTLFHLSCWKSRGFLKEGKRVAINLAPGFFLPAVSFLFLFWPTLRDGFNRPLGGSYGAAELCSANVFQFLLPSGINPFLGGISSWLTDNEFLASVPDTPFVYFGLGGTMVALFVFFKYRRRERMIFFFGILGLVGYLLSLGPIVRALFLPLLAGPVAPLWYFSHLPLVNNARCPVRFSQIVVLSIAVLLSFGLGRLLESKKFIYRIFLSLVLGLVVTFEFATFNFPQAKATIPAIYREIDSGDDRVLLELPSGVVDGFESFGVGGDQETITRQMYYQTIHQRKRVGGYLSRVPNKTFDFFKTEPIISDLFRLIDEGSQGRTINYQESKIESFLRKFNLGYILVWPHKNQEAVVKYINKNFQKFILGRKNNEGFILFVLKKWEK